MRTVEENLLRKGTPVDVEVVEVTSPCFQGLREKDYDFISPVHGDEVDLTDLEDELFLREPICAVVPTGCPLYERDVLNLHDLDGQTVFVSHERSIRHYFTWIEEELARLGVHPNYVAAPYGNWFEFNHMPPRLAGRIGLVHAGMPSISMPQALQKYRAIRFDDDDFRLPVHITWRAKDDSEALRLFVDEFRSVMNATDFSAYWSA